MQKINLIPLEPLGSVSFFIINNFIQQVRIRLFKSNSKYIYATKDFCFK